MKRDALIVMIAAVVSLGVGLFVGHAIGSRSAEARVVNVLLRDQQPEKRELLERYAPSYQQMIDEYTKPLPAE